MKRHFSIAICFLVILMVIGSTAYGSRGLRTKNISPSGKTVTGDNWLFVIGINNYTKWTRLKTAVNDAKSLKKVLLDRYSYNKKNVVELYNEKATRRNIIGKLRYLAKNIKKDDSLVIFYAGHGHIDSITRAGSWIPVDSDISNSSDWISNHDIKTYLSVNAIKAKHLLLISDSCFSGDFFRGKRGRLPKVTSAVIKKAFKLTSRQAITSGGLEPVSDAGFGNNSVFSHFLIKTLKENTNPFLIPSELFPDVKAGVAENAEQFPQFGSLKGTGGQQGGELIFFLKQNTRLKDLSGITAKKSRELIRLQKLEKEEQLAKKREQVEIAKRNREIALMDAKIASMKKRLGTSYAREDDSLKNMFAMVKDKEAQDRRLEELKRKKANQAIIRQAEIKRLKEIEKYNALVILKKDIKYYTGIVSSKYGKDMADAAWRSLVKKYPERAEGLSKGDTKGLVSSGWLNIDVKPENAQVNFIDNSNLRYQKGMRLKSGSYKIKVTLKNHGAIEKTIEIIHGENSIESFELVYIEPSFVNSLGQKFVYIRPGSFMIGDNGKKPVHRVTLTRGFYMQTTEVTQRQWRSVMGSNPSYSKGDNRPVEKVSWNDVRRFIDRLNSREGSSKYRLPTEAEWEYACRAGSNTDYANGNTLDSMGWYKRNSSGKTHEVAQKKPNAWGLYDVHGNVWEWCEDWYGNYSSGSVTNPVGPSSGSNRVRVNRGGSYLSSASDCRSAFRSYDGPGYGVNILGFRLCRTR